MDSWIMLTAITTMVIGFCAMVSLVLAFWIKFSNDMFRQQMSDLIKAIVVSNLLDPEHLPSSIKGRDVIKEFNRLYEEVRTGPDLFARRY